MSYMDDQEYASLLDAAERRLAAKEAADRLHGIGGPGPLVRHGVSGRLLGGPLAEHTIMDRLWLVALWIESAMRGQVSLHPERFKAATLNDPEVAQEYLAEAFVLLCRVMDELRDTVETTAATPEPPA